MNQPWWDVYSNPSKVILTSSETFKFGIMISNYPVFIECTRGRIIRAFEDFTEIKNSHKSTDYICYNLFKVESKIIKLVAIGNGEDRCECQTKQ